MFSIFIIQLTVESNYISMDYSFRY
jgi:hypothetical protein